MILTATQRIEAKASNVMHHYEMLRAQFIKIDDIDSNLSSLFSQIDTTSELHKIELIEDSINLINKAITEKKVRLELAEAQLEYIVESLKERRHVKDDRFDELHEMVKTKPRMSGTKRTKVSQNDDESKITKRGRKPKTENQQIPLIDDQSTPSQSLHEFDIKTELKENDREMTKTKTKEKKKDKKKEKEKEDEEMSDIPSVKTKKAARIKTLHQIECENEGNEHQSEYELTNIQQITNTSSVSKEDEIPFKKTKKSITKAKQIFEMKELPIISENVELLMDWVEMPKMKVVYDSQIDLPNSTTLFDKIKRLNNLYFFFIDDKNEIFGSFISNKITTETTMETYDEVKEDECHFVFTLHGINEQEKSRQYVPKKYAEMDMVNSGNMEEDQMEYQYHEGGMFLWKMEKGDEHFLTIGNGDIGWLEIGKYGKKVSYNHELWKVYDGLTKNETNGRYSTFTVQRLVVIQMKY